jgi:hypothetical protein
LSTPVRASDHDLRALAAIVSQDRPDLPDGEGLPPSLLADLIGQIRCDALSLDSWDTGRQACWFSQEIPSGDAAIDFTPFDQVFWDNYWDCQHCSYAARTGDLRSVVTTADFYSARQWHATGMYTDRDRLLGLEHFLMVCLPKALPPSAGPGRYVRLTLCRGPGPDFSERDRAVLTLLGPHLDQAYLDAERHRHPLPRLTPRQRDLLHLVAAGHQHPDRPPARHLRDNRAHPPGKHLRKAARLQPHRRRHPRLPQPCRLAKPRRHCPKTSPLHGVDRRHGPGRCTTSR